MATPQCLSNFYSTVISCGYVYGAIFLWDVLTLILYNQCLSERIRGAPYLDAQFYGVAGVVQLTAVSLALVRFRPVCECSISCPSYIPILYVVPAFELLIGIFCWLEACRRRHMAEQVSNDGVFTKVPTEMELTEIDEVESSDDEVVYTDKNKLDEEEG